MPARRCGLLGAEVGEPAVVRARAREPALVLLGRRRRRDVIGLVVERRHRVREDHLADDAVALEVGAALGRVPVLGLLAAEELLRRVPVAAAPGVEVGALAGSRYSRYMSIAAPAWVSAVIMM